MARLIHLYGRLGRGLLPWLLPIAIVTAWEIAARAGWLSSRILPEPFAVVQAGVTLAASGELWQHVKVSALRALTGFAIGGVAPVGHLTEIAAFIDPRLLEFDQVWAAAGTPRHVFAISPDDLVRVSGARPADFTA